MVFKQYKKPASIEEAYALLIEKPNNTIIGGGAWLKLLSSNYDTVIDLSSLNLNEITKSDNCIEIGSCVTLREVETSEEIKSLSNGILSDAVYHIMGMNIRNIATIGGSVMGKFSFSDILTPLLVLDTTLVFFNYGEISLQDFLNEKKFPKDILLKIKIHCGNEIGYFKTVKKTALDFPVINFAITKGDELKIAVGSRPGQAKRAFKAEKLNDIDAIVKAVSEEISLSKNNRASKEYREELLHVYIKRGLQEVLAQ